MHVIEVNGIEYKCLESWKEMPISKAIEIQQILDDIPSLLKELYDLRVSKSETKKEDINKLIGKIDTKDRIKHFPLFYGEVIKALTDIPGDVMEEIMWDMRTQFYNMYCERLVTGLLYGDYDHIKPIKSFRFKGEIYWLPKEDHVLGKPVPMADAQTIEFTEVADLEIYSEQLKGGKYQVSPNIISILCRPKDEAYNEKKSLARADKFMDLTMDIVWEVFFCIHRLSIISSQNIQIYTLKRVLAQQKNSKHPVLKRLAGMAGSLRSRRRALFRVISKGKMQ